MIREETSARTRLAVAGRSRSDRGEQLCAASPDCGRPACSTDCRSASRLPASGVLHSCKSRRRRCRSVARSSRILWFASSAGFARRCSADICGSHTASKSPITAPAGNCRRTIHSPRRALRRAARHWPRRLVSGTTSARHRVRRQPSARCLGVAVARRDARRRRRDIHRFARCRKVPQIAPPRAHARSARRGISRGLASETRRRRDPAASQIISI